MSTLLGKVRFEQSAYSQLRPALVIMRSGISTRGSPEHIVADAFPPGPPQDPSSDLTRRLWFALMAGAHGLAPLGAAAEPWKIPVQGLALVAYNVRDGDVLTGTWTARVPGSFAVTAGQWQFDVEIVGELPEADGIERVETLGKRPIA